MNEGLVNVCFYLSSHFRKKVFIVLIFNHRLHQIVRDACLGGFVMNHLWDYFTKQFLVSMHQ